jgi:HD-GYP domain-containing protein (c-di-GMP phosphodiesterase class II)
MDGSGFPLKIKNLPLEARIVAVCDSFDEMICGICCERVKVHEALEYLKVFRGKQFDEHVTDVFLEFIAVYPVGSYVLINSGETGVVVRQNREFSNRPVIKIIKDKKGDTLTIPREIDLVKEKTVFIEKVLDN